MENVIDKKVKIKQKKEKPRKEKNPLLADSWQLYLMAAIPVLLVFIFSYTPMYGVIIAFKRYTYADGIFGSEWVGFNNFKFFFASSDFANIVWNTISMNIVFIITGTLSALAVGILLYMVASRNATKVFQTLLITPNFLSWVIVAYMLYAMINPEFGVFIKAMENRGFETVDFYSTPGVWPFILTVANIWKHVGMDSVIYYAALMGISQDLFEAADIDGANTWDKIKYIIVPELKTLITMLTIIKVGGIFSADFGLFYQLPMDCGALYSTTDVINTYIFRTMRVLGNMGMSSAAGLVQSAVGMILVVTTNAIVNKVDPDSALF